MKMIKIATLFVVSLLCSFILLTAQAKAEPTFYESYVVTDETTVTCPEDYLVIICGGGDSAPVIGGVTATLANYSPTSEGGTATYVWWLLSPKGGFTNATLSNTSGLIDIFYGTKHVYVPSAPCWDVDDSTWTGVSAGVYYTGLSVATYADHGSVVLAYVTQRDSEPPDITPSVVAPSGATYSFTSDGLAGGGGQYLAGAYSTYVDAGDVVTPYLSTNDGGAIMYNAVCVDIW